MEQDDVPPLSEVEIRYVRRIIRRDENTRWLWGLMRRMAGWSAATVAGAAALVQIIARFFEAKQ